MNIFFELLWPSRCAACQGLVPMNQPFCMACKETLLPSEAADLSWPSYALAPPKEIPPESLGAISVFGYGGGLTQAILRFKHGGKRHLARPLGKLMSLPLARLLGEGPAIACPVPLHPRRLRQRGFNQSLELLRQAASGLPTQTGLTLCPDLLRRTRDTEAMGHATRHERQERVQGAFCPTDPAPLAHAHVVLVDDVLTTGATTLECAKILWAKGARKITILTLATALPAFLP